MGGAVIVGRVGEELEDPMNEKKFNENHHDTSQEGRKAISFTSSQQGANDDSSNGLFVS